VEHDSRSGWKTHEGVLRRANQCAESMGHPSAVDAIRVLLGEGRSRAWISEKLGINRFTVTLWMRMYGIAPPEKPLSPSVAYQRGTGRVRLEEVHVPVECHRGPLRVNSGELWCTKCGEIVTLEDSGYFCVRCGERSYVLAEQVLRSGEFVVSY
jgi:hypothetical protein